MTLISGPVMESGAVSVALSLPVVSYKEQLELNREQVELLTAFLTIQKLKQWGFIPALLHRVVKCMEGTPEEKGARCRLWNGTHPPSLMDLLNAEDLKLIAHQWHELVGIQGEIILRQVVAAAMRLLVRLSKAEAEAEAEAKKS